MTAPPAAGAHAAELQAARRDAALYKSPGYARRYHILIDGLAACNRTERYRRGAMPLVEDAAMPARLVSTLLRCRRPACAAKFAEAGCQGRAAEERAG